MKHKIMIAMGLVALGIWQITAQQDAPITAEERQEMQQVLQSSPFVLQQPQFVGEQPLGVWIIMARAREIESSTVWACEGNERPPNCGIVANRPPNVSGCNPWQYTFSWAKSVTCPPDHTYNFTFWTPNGPNGGFLQVGYWTPGLPPSGTCDPPGYLSDRSMPPMIDSVCLRNPSPTPTPTPLCPPNYYQAPCPTPPPNYTPVPWICCPVGTNCYWGYFPTCGCYNVVCCNQYSCLDANGKEVTFKNGVATYPY